MPSPEKFLPTSDFNYNLPKNLIAQEPLLERDKCKLMVLHRFTKKILHKNFVNIVEFFSPGDVLVLNDARVMPWRLYGKTENGKDVEALLIQEVSELEWEAILKPGKRIKRGVQIVWENTLSCVVTDRKDNGLWVLRFNTFNIKDLLQKFGNAPLPPYIKRSPFHPMRKVDRIMYQSVFSSSEGAIAAPTAGLHFTENLLHRLREKGVNVCFITLLVGRGSFEPIRTTNVVEHRMGAEMFEIKKEVADLIEDAKDQGKRVFACGTTVVRALETSALKDGRVKPSSGFTTLFIYPGFKFKVVDCMITNFHMPCSSPLVMTAAFAGREFLLKAYEEAKKAGYRFLSYGDAMLII